MDRASPSFGTVLIVNSGGYLLTGPHNHLKPSSKAFLWRREGPSSRASA